MRPERDVVERNVSKLLRRSYLAEHPRPEFRAELRELLLERFRDLPVAVGRRRPRRSLRLLPIAVCSAAAALAVAAALFLVHRAPEPAALADLLARGDVALRRAPTEPFAAAEGNRAVLPESGTLEIVTPLARAFDVDSVPSGALTIEADSRVEASAPAATGESDVRLTAYLRTGGMRAVRTSGDSSWVLHTREGSIALRRGDVRVFHSGGAVRVSVASGEAWLEQPAGPRRLGPGADLLLSGGTVEPVRPAAGSPASAPRVELVEREPEPRVPGPDLAGDAAAVPHTSLYGAVVDADTELPVAGCILYLLALERNGEAAYGEEPLVDAAEPTGEFRLPGVAAGRYRLFAFAADYAVYRSRDFDLGPERPPIEVDCALNRGATVRGRVIDEAGRPIERALVLCEADAPYLMLPLAEEHLLGYGAVTARAVATDAEGRFELPHLRPGTPPLRATRPGYAPGWWSGARVAPGDSIDDVEIRLGKGGAVHGRVTDAAGEPVAKAYVIASPQWLAPSQSGQPMGVGVTDAAGRYSIEDLPPGPHIVIDLGRELGVGATAAQQVRPIQIRAGSSAQVDFIGGGGATRLEGRLLQADGAPLARASLSLALAGASSSASDAAWIGTSTDADGTFAIPELDLGVYELFEFRTATGDVVRLAEITVSERPSQRIEVRLAAGAAAGRAVDAASGEPLPGAFALLERLAAGPEAPAFAGKAKTDADGTVTFERLEPGTYRCQIYPDDARYAYSESAPFVVSASGTARFDVAVPLGASVELRVLSRSGEPVPGAKIELVDSAGRAFDTEFPLETGTDGSVRVDRLREGAWIARARAGTFGAEVRAALRAGEVARFELHLDSP